MAEVSNFSGAPHKCGSPPKNGKIPFAAAGLSDYSNSLSVFQSAEGTHLPYADTGGGKNAVSNHTRILKQCFNQCMHGGSPPK